MKIKSLVLIGLLLCFTAAAYADSTNPGAFRAPTVYKGAVATTVYWTAGTINNGGDSVAVAAGSVALTTSKADCSAPAFASCDILYANSAGAVALTNAIGTAIASGNTLLAFIETGAADAILTNLVLPSQSGTLWNQAGGPASTGLTAVTASGAGTVPLGSAALPFSGAYIGTAATNNVFLSAIATGAARNVKLCDNGAAGALCLADPAVTTKQLILDLSGATAASTIAINTANRTLTIADPGGAATFAFINPTSVTSFSGGVDFNTAVLPHATGLDLGSTTQNFRALFLHGAGTYGTDYFKITGTSTSGMRTITLPDASITVSGAVAQSCGVVNACDHTAISTNVKIVQGITAALDGASPSVAAVTGMSPAFTNTTSYSCSATLEGTTAASAAKGVAVTQVSGSAVTFYSANGATEKVHYVCVGY
jgi:hypothetical protein